ncbi:hypothetical protein AYO20_05757 [Fonsecaea nubica]|uniref:PARP-type domain-containing protein n=1 Tax=Fonsecaea nubica TaxID=856822 RepID=A0A178D0M8_9EURO|nr:hypothetical protein AYO20_05757 [Fonsecaea nubica]OAL35042.1 hypothetical protein AYO20_05757 [Fonsecaea nubica]
MASDPTYRFEMAKTGRAGCQNTACKKAGIKIEKGEFRMGTLVTIHEHSSWMWKHWGCVTPAQIKKLQDQVGPLEDLDDLDADLDRIIDGYDEIDDGSREKIKYALMNGHVADEDWKGDPEFNRPGMKGINKRTPKKKEAGDDEEIAAENEQTPSKPKAKRGKKAKVLSDEEEDLPESPAAKKKTSRRKIKEEEDDAQPAQSAPPKKAGGRKRKVAVKEEDSEEEAPEKPTKRSRAKKVKSEEVEEKPAKPVKRERQRKKAASSKDSPEDEDVKETIEPASDALEARNPKRKVAAQRERAKSGRRTKPVKYEETQTGDEDSDDAPARATPRPEAADETGDEVNAGNNLDAVPEGYIGALRQNTSNTGQATTGTANANMDEDNASDVAEKKKPKETKGRKGKVPRQKNTKGREI